MHLLVLSAFRPQADGTGQAEAGLNAPFGAQCFPTDQKSSPLSPLPQSQCTFWCSVLSDHMAGFLSRWRGISCLNAPFGAQCFPTRLPRRLRRRSSSQCTFWCSVLSDMPLCPCRAAPTMPSQCTFWCSVLSDVIGGEAADKSWFRLNAPFGAQCFPTEADEAPGEDDRVSMHLLVLSAFRLFFSSAARCRGSRVSMHLLVLSAFRLGV